MSDVDLVDSLDEPKRHQTRTKMICSARLSVLEYSNMFPSNEWYGVFGSISGSGNRAQYKLRDALTILASPLMLCYGGTYYHITYSPTQFIPLILKY